MSFWRDLRFSNALVDTDCPEPLIRPCLGPRGQIVGKSGSSARVWKWDGSWRILSENGVGGWCGAIDYVGRAVWQELGVGVVREILPLTALPAGTLVVLMSSAYEVLPDVPYASSGIRDIEPTNRIVPDDGSQLPFVRENGITILIPKACVRGDRVAGYASNLPGGDGVVVGEFSTRRLWRVWEGDPQSLPIRLDDDGKMVAISGPYGGFFPESGWRLEPLVTPLTAPAIFGAFVHQSLHGQRPSWANAVIDCTPGVYPGRLVGDHGEWHVYDHELQQGVRTSPCCHVGSPDALASAHLEENAYDLVAPWIYPEAGETADAFAAKASGTINAMQQAYPRMQLVPIWRVDTRVGTDGQPTLDEDQVVRCLTIASSYRLPALFFQAGRTGFVDEAVPVLSSWRNGQPSPAPVYPPEDHMTVTIVSYAPTSGQVPLSVRAVASHEGAVDRYQWRYRLLGGPSWMTAAVNPVSDNDHTYVFDLAATYEISLAGLDTLGNVVAETGLQRLVVATPKPDDAEAQALARLDAALLEMKGAVDNMHFVLGK